MKADMLHTDKEHKQMVNFHLSNIFPSNIIFVCINVTLNYKQGNPVG